MAEPFLRRAFVRHDPLGAYARHAAPDFKEHDPKIGDGLEAHRAYWRSEAGRRAARRTRVFDMILVHDDLFAVFHHGFRNAEDRGAAAVDLWRVDNGRIVEHWNVVQASPETAVHQNGIACGRGETYRSARALRGTFARPTCGLPDPHASGEATRRVIGAYIAEIGGGDIRGAITRWFSPDYRQHSPMIPDGVEGAITYLEREFGNTSAAKPRLGPMRVLAEGDLILFHHMVTYPGERPTALIDVFRVADGKISEHWDLKQLSPEAPANNNGMW